MACRFWNPKLSPAQLPIKDMGHKDVILNRLEDQLVWYDNKSVVSEIRFKTLKVIAIISAGLVPLVVMSDGDLVARLITASLGLIVTVCEGLQQLNQYQQNWISYRATAEALKHEMYIFGAQAGDYAVLDESLRYQRLAERVESLVSVEHAKWIANQTPGKDTHKSDPAAKPPTVVSPPAP